jgi:hypothetical protein
LLFSRGDGPRLPERVRSAIGQGADESPVFTCLAEVVYHDPSRPYNDLRDVLMVITDLKVHLIDTRRNAIFYPNYQVGRLLMSIELVRISSVRGMFDGRLELMKIYSDEDTLIVRGLKTVSNFEGLKVAAGGPIPFIEFIDSLLAVSTTSCDIRTCISAMRTLASEGHKG